MTADFQDVSFGEIAIVVTSAHVGHWLADLIILAPVLAVGAWIAIAAIRDRRRGERNT